MSKRKKLSSEQDEIDDLEALGKKVKAAQDAHNPEQDEDATSWAVGIRYASEFSAAVIVGGLGGAGIDYFAGTKPWGLLVGIILGFMAGTRTIIRSAKEMGAEDGES